jgi:hypothetical protein
MHPRPPSHSPPPGTASQGGGLSCCVAPSNTLPDPDHPDLTPCPPNSSVRRTGLAVASGWHRSNPAPAGGPLFRRSAPTRVACSANALPPARRMGKDAQEHTEDAATGPAPRRGWRPTGSDDRGAGSAFGRVRRAACAARSRRGCPVQAGCASRSSGVMRASTALRTSGPALCSMALQSAVLWMVATMPRSKS